MSEILFVHHTLQLGGGEKLIKELVDFSIKNSIRPTVVIPDKLEEEYYDSYLKSVGVKVVRFKVYKKSELISCLFSKHAYWNFYARYALQRKFKTVHFVNLGIGSQYYYVFRHARRKFWHVGNAIQYDNRRLPFYNKIFQNASNEIICINKFQIKEIIQQFKPKCKITTFKLFLND